MVKFWDEMRQRELSKINLRISLAEKHGVGKMAMEEKARKIKLQKLISDSKL